MNYYTLGSESYLVLKIQKCTIYSTLLHVFFFYMITRGSRKKIVPPPPGNWSDPRLVVRSVLCYQSQFNMNSGDSKIFSRHGGFRNISSTAGGFRNISSTGGIRNIGSTKGGLRILVLLQPGV